MTRNRTGRALLLCASVAAAVCLRPAAEAQNFVADRAGNFRMRVYPGIGERKIADGLFKRKRPDLEQLYAALQRAGAAAVRQGYW